MASIVLSSVGQSVGNMIMPGLGGRVLGYLGSRAGKLIDQEIGLTSDTSNGARLDSFSIQDSKYGLAIPVVYGHARIAGNLIWASDLIETSHEEGGIGKGGGIVGSSKTTYTYSIHCAVALCEGKISGIQTIWADSKIIYQNGAWQSGVVGHATIYHGAEDQEADPLMESYEGSGNVPAYKNMAYIVLESLELSNFGNRLPNLSFEVLPKEVSGQPVWLGDSDPALSVEGYSNVYGGAAPIILYQSGSTVRRILTNGYLIVDNVCRFYVCEVDISGDEPVEISRVASDPIGVASIANQSWAMAPDGRFVVLGFQGATAPYNYHAMIYDTQSKSFGPVLQVESELYEYMQLAWLDQHRIVLSKTFGTARGVHLLMRSGMGIIDLGYQDVWGIGAKTSRHALGCTQFLPTDTGLLCIASNQTGNYTALYAVHIAWANNLFAVGDEYVLSSGFSFGTGSAPRDYLLQLSDDEYCFVHSTTKNVSLMTFVPEADSVQITRAWNVISTTDAYGLASRQAPVLFGNCIAFIQKPVYANLYYVSEYQHYCPVKRVG